MARSLSGRYYYVSIDNGYTDESIVGMSDDNRTILETALNVFTETGGVTVAYWKTLTGLPNSNEATWYDESKKDIFNRFYYWHFLEFEKLLIKSCEELGNMISLKKDKQDINAMYEVLIGYREYYYDSGLCSDILNDATFDYVENGFMTRNTANRINSNPFAQFCLMQVLLQKFAKKLVKILENHELPCIYDKNSWHKITELMNFNEDG